MAKTIGMEFFRYHRDRPGSATLRDELIVRRPAAVIREPAGPAENQAAGRP
jgi:hypothetical protein